MSHHIESNLLKHDEYKIMYAVEVKKLVWSVNKEETNQGSDLEVTDSTRQLLKTSYGASWKESSPKERHPGWPAKLFIKCTRERNTKEQKIIKLKRQWNATYILCVKNGRKHGGMKRVKKLKNWNGNTKPKRLHTRQKWENDIRFKWRYQQMGWTCHWNVSWRETWPTRCHWYLTRTAVLLCKSEIENVIKEMKCGKAGGNDGIATKMIKALDDEGIKKIKDLCNLVYNQHRIYSTWYPCL